MKAIVLSNENIIIRAWLNWGITTFFVIFQFFLQTSAGIMAQYWKIDFHINALAVANLSAAFFYVYVLMQIPAGLAYDRYNPRIIVTYAAIALALGCLIFSYTHSYYIAFLARALMGFGASFGFIGMLQISALWFNPSAFPMMVSLAETLGTVFTACSEILLAWLVINFGWRHTIFCASITAIFIAFLAFIIIRNKPSTVEPAKNITENVTQQSIWQILFELSKNKQIWIVGIYGFFTFALITVFTSLWGIPFLTTIHHFNLHIAAEMISMVFLGVASGTLILSWISMRMRRRKPMLFVSAFGLTVLMSILLCITNLTPTIIYFLLFFSGFFTACYVLCFALIKELVSKNYRATALAIINMFMMISGPILQPFVGWIISHQLFAVLHSLALTYKISLIILPIGFFISAILVFFMQESYCQECS